MSVLVKDMKIPERCLDCPIYDHYNYYCKLYSFGIPARYNGDGSIRPEWCELVELPEKHGKLFDEAEVKKVLHDLPDSKDKWGAIALFEWAVEKRWCVEAEGEE